jgi:ribose 5-phosphate isomerase A
MINNHNKLDLYKQQAAEAAVTSIQSGMVVGLGTGSTAVYAIRALGRLLQSGDRQDIVAIPTSEASAEEARAWQIPLSDLNQHPTVDVTIDGADEIDPHLNLIKGLGGALLREKIVALASRQVIIVSDYTKRVGRLGERAPVPVEVIPFAYIPVATYLKSLGARVMPRQQNDDLFYTDEGNIILDCYFEAINDASALAHALRARSGVVEHGLFLGIATQAIVAGPEGLLHLQP